MTTGSVVSLWRYPVKSMQGERLEESPIGPRGLAGDRAYALIDAETGHLGSAKHPRQWPGLFECRAAFVDHPGATDAPPPAVITLPDGATIRTDDPGIDERMSELVGRRVRLASIAPENPVIEEVWPEEKGPDFYGPVHEEKEDGHAVIDFRASLAVPGAFFDLSAIHLVTTNTLDELATREPDMVFDERRFRPNIVVRIEGREGFVENDWGGKQLRVGEAVLAVVIATPRCVMTTLAIDEIPKDGRILRAVRDHNRVEVPGIGTFPCIGVNASVAQGGAIRVGDEVVLGTGRPSG